MPSVAFFFNYFRGLPDGFSPVGEALDAAKLEWRSYNLPQFDVLSRDPAYVSIWAMIFMLHRKASPFLCGLHKLATAHATEWLQEAVNPEKVNSFVCTA